MAWRAAAAIGEAQGVVADMVLVMKYGDAMRARWAAVRAEVDAEWASAKVRAAEAEIQRREECERRVREAARRRRDEEEEALRVWQ